MADQLTHFTFTVQTVHVVAVKLASEKELKLWIILLLHLGQVFDLRSISRHKFGQVVNDGPVFWVLRRFGWRRFLHIRRWTLQHGQQGILLLLLLLLLLVNELLRIHDLRC